MVIVAGALILGTMVMPTREGLWNQYGIAIPVVAGVIALAGGRIQASAARIGTGRRIFLFLCGLVLYIILHMWVGHVYWVEDW